MHLHTISFQCLNGTELVGHAIILIGVLRPLLPRRKYFASAEHQLLDTVVVHKVLRACQTNAACATCDPQHMIRRECAYMVYCLWIKVCIAYQLLQYRAVAIALPVAYFHHVVALRLELRNNLPHYRCIIGGWVDIHVARP